MIRRLLLLVGIVLLLLLAILRAMREDEPLLLVLNHDESGYFLHPPASLADAFRLQDVPTDSQFLGWFGGQMLFLHHADIASYQLIRHRIYTSRRVGVTSVPDGMRLYTTSSIERSASGDWVLLDGDTTYLSGTGWHTEDWLVHLPTLAVKRLVTYPPRVWYGDELFFLQYDFNAPLSRAVVMRGTALDFYAEVPFGTYDQNHEVIGGWLYLLRRDEADAPTNPRLELVRVDLRGSGRVESLFVPPGESQATPFAYYFFVDEAAPGIDSLYRVDFQNFREAQLVAEGVDIWRFDLDLSHLLWIDTAQRLYSLDLRRDAPRRIAAGVRWAEWRPDGRLRYWLDESEAYTLVWPDGRDPITYASIYEEAEFLAESQYGASFRRDSAGQLLLVGENSTGELWESSLYVDTGTYHPCCGALSFDRSSAYPFGRLDPATGETIPYKVAIDADANIGFYLYLDSGDIWFMMDNQPYILSTEGEFLRPDSFLSGFSGDILPRRDLTRSALLSKRAPHWLLWGVVAVGLGVVGLRWRR